MVDVYRGDVPAQKNILSLGAYISMFPQLIAGPIVRYADVAQMLNSRKENAAQFAAGVNLFIIGLGNIIDGIDYYDLLQVVVGVFNVIGGGILGVRNASYVTVSWRRMADIGTGNDILDFILDFVGELVSVAAEKLYSIVFARRCLGNTFIR